MRFSNLPRTLVLCASIALAVSFMGSLAQSAGSAQTEQSIAHFMEASKTFRHPRCLNCHPAGERPTQGDDMHAHIMNVQRGLDDKGLPGQRCTTCHNQANYEYSGVPGAPKWALAPRSMAWQGLSDRELCLTLKDIKKNHGMSMEEMIHHNGEDKLVAWGWDPGSDRTPIPGSQKQFGEIIREWVTTGAACPGDAGGPTTVAGKPVSKEELAQLKARSKKEQTQSPMTIH